MQTCIYDWFLLHHWVIVKAVFTVLLYKQHKRVAPTREHVLLGKRRNRWEDKSAQKTTLSRTSACFCIIATTITPYERLNIASFYIGLFKSRIMEVANVSICISYLVEVKFGLMQKRVKNK